MFKRAITITIALLVFAITMISLKVFWVTDTDRLAHNQTVEYLQPSKANNSGTSHRNLVTKNLWMQRQEHVYQYQIKSQDSILHLDQPRATDTRATEKMEVAECLVQQKLYYVDDKGKEIKAPLPGQDERPMQQICKIRVNQGVYHYFTKDFEGEKGQLEVYTLEGHALPKSLDAGQKILDGHYDKISFYFVDSVPNLKVENLSAKVFGEGLQ